MSACHPGGKNTVATAAAVATGQMALSGFQPSGADGTYLPRPETRRLLEGKASLTSRPSSAGYLVPVRHGDVAKLHTRRRRRSARRDRPVFECSVGQAERVLSRRAVRSPPRMGWDDYVAGRSPSDSGGRWPNSAGALHWDTTPSAAMSLGPATNRPDRSLINDAARNKDQAQQAIQARAVRQQLLLESLEERQRPSTAPPRRVARSSASKAGRGSRNKPPAPAAAKVDSPNSTQLLHTAGESSSGALRVEILRADGLQLPEPHGRSAHRMRSFCQATLQGVSWRTEIAQGSAPAFNHVCTNFVDGKEACLVVHVLAGTGKPLVRFASRRGRDFVEQQQRTQAEHDPYSEVDLHIGSIAIPLSTLQQDQAEERWIDLRSHTGDLSETPPKLTPAETARGAIPVGRLLVRTKFVDRAADTTAMADENFLNDLANRDEELAMQMRRSDGKLTVGVIAGKLQLGQPADTFVVVEYNGHTSMAGEVVFSTIDPRWNAVAGPFDVPSGGTTNHKGPSLNIRILRWRAVPSTAKSAAYDLVGAVSIHLPHALHCWARANAASADGDNPSAGSADGDGRQQQSSSSSDSSSHLGGSFAVESWVGLHGWKTDAGPVCVAQCGEVKLLLHFSTTTVLNVPRPLPVNLQVCVNLLQLHRIENLMGHTDNSVRCEITMHANRRDATARMPPYDNDTPCYKTEIEEEMYSPCFFETSIFELFSAHSCIRVDVYEVIYDNSSPARLRPGMPGSLPSHPATPHSFTGSSRPGSPNELSSMRSPSSFNATSLEKLWGGEANALMGSSGDDEHTSATPSHATHATASKKPPKEQLLYSVVIPVLTLVGTTTAHWFKLNPPEPTFSLQQCEVVDHHIEVTGSRAHRLLPHGAVQLSAKIERSNGAFGQLQLSTTTSLPITPSQAFSPKQPRQMQGAISVSDISANGLLDVRTTNRVGVETKHKIPPNVYVEFSCFNTVRQTSVVKGNHNPSWDETITFPFGGDGYQISKQGAISVKVYHHAGKKAVNSRVLLGSVSFSLAEMSEDIKRGNRLAYEPVVHTHVQTLFQSQLLKKAGVLKLKACGELTMKFTVIPLDDEELGDLVMQSKASTADMSQQEKACEHPLRPNVALRYAVATAHWLHNLPKISLKSSLTSKDLHAASASTSAGSNPYTPISTAVKQTGNIEVEKQQGTVVVVTLTVHSWKNAEDAKQSACRIYLEGSDGELASGVFSVPLLPSALPATSENSSTTSTEQAQTVQIHYLEKEAVGVIGDHQLVVASSSSLDLVVDIVEESVANNEKGSNKSVTFTYGRIRLPVQFVEDWKDQQWHDIKRDDSSLESSAIKLSGSVQRVTNHIPDHIADVKPVSMPAGSETADEELQHTTQSDGKCVKLKLAGVAVTQTTVLSQHVNSSTEGGSVPAGVRTFFDTVSLNIIHEIDSFLVLAQHIWMSDGGERPVEDVIPRALETFALLAPPHLDNAKLEEGKENVVTQLRTYGKANAIIHWSFKQYCSFWHRLVASTIDYGIELGKSFKEVYNKHQAKEIFLELDVDDSGELENEEVDELLKWLFGQVFGESISEAQARDRDIEKKHFKYRLDPDQDGKVTFDELHDFIVSMIHWVDELYERRVAVEFAEQQRAVECIQKQVRAFLLRKALAMTIRNSIPAEMTEALLWIGEIPLANAQTHHIRSKLELMGCSVRAVAIHCKPGKDGKHHSWALAAFNDAESANRVHFANTENHFTFMTASSRDPTEGAAFDPLSAHPGSQLHVRGVGVHGWDGSEEGRGEYEDLDKLMDLFNAFGQCHHVVIRHRIEIDPPHDRDDENFVRRRNSSWAIVTMADRASAERVRDAKVMAGDHQLKIAPFDNKRAVNSTGGMQVVRLKTAIDAKPPGHYVLKCDTHGVTYKIRKCNLPKLHSKKALKALMTIWDRFPTLCVSNLPTTVKNDDLQNAFSKFGQISAICVVDSDATDTKDNWGLCTFSHQAGLDKALKELQTAGGLMHSGHIFKIAEATQSVVNAATLVTLTRRNEWKKVGGHGNDLAKTAMKAEQIQEMRETPDQVAARLARSFKTHAFNVEKIISKRTDATGGNEEFQVSWLGRYISPDWLPKETLMRDPITWGMVKAFEEDLKAPASTE